jgi:sugar lactone lactonase YvrE
MAGSGFQGVRWRPTAPAFPVPKRSDPRTLPPLTFLPLPGQGPEHVAVDTRGRLLTGLADGRIVRVDPAGGVETLANTGGRPLGLEFSPGPGGAGPGGSGPGGSGPGGAGPGGADSLVVGDAERGLLHVRLGSRAGSATGVTVLCDSVGGRRLRFCSCPAVATDGTVYFSQSSQRYGLAHYKGDLLEHSGTGRVLRLRDGQVDVVADGLQFANGVVLAPDESRLLVAETAGYRITSIALRGDRAGQTRTLIDGLPGFPDNLSPGPGGLIWIGMASPRDALLDLLLPRAPWLRAGIWSLPERLKPGPKNMAWALAIDQDGTVVHDLRGWNVGYHEVTAVREHDGKLYLASIEESALACLDLPGTA